MKTLLPLSQEGKEKWVNAEYLKSNSLAQQTQTGSSFPLDTKIFEFIQANFGETSDRHNFRTILYIHARQWGNTFLGETKEL